MVEEPEIDQGSGSTAACRAPAITADGGVLPVAWEFVRTRIWCLAAISVALLTPVFWHKHVVLCDFGSHIYNGWLATLIAKGQAPGVYAAHLWNNVLCDLLLAWLGPLAGWAAAERIVVSGSVLVFFWGGFALASAAARRAAWFLLPALAMVAYGWTFQIGFSNYYLSLGLGFLAAALLWRGRGRELICGAALLPLVLLAHPFGFVFAVGLAGYARLREGLPGIWKVLPPVAAAASIFLARGYLEGRYPVKFASALPLFLMNGLNGVDQLVLGPPYRTLARAVFLTGVGCFAFDCVDRVIRKRSWKSVEPLAIPLELYGIALLAIAVLPDAVKLPQYEAWISFLLMRFSSIAAVLALCLLACVTPRKVHFAIFGVMALGYFALVYRDTGVFSRMQEQADQLVAQLPPGQRVIATIRSLPYSRFYFLARIVDRACVERCYSYNNYEPASQAFRLRALPGSPIVSASLRDVEFMEAGVYRVQPGDLPMYDIYQCDGDPTKLCMRPLRAGELNGPPADAAAVLPQ